MERDGGCIPRIMGMKENCFKNLFSKLARKLRWRKATKSNFCDKVFIGFENHENH